MTAPAPLARAALLHAAGVEANAQMRPLVALRHLRRALSLLDGTTGPEAALLRGRVLVTAALAESERGEVAAGLADLDEAEPLLPRDERGTLHGQRGILLRRTGHDDLALEAYGKALQLLDPVTQPEEVARVRLNRSVMLTVAAHPAAARADLEACLELARAHGFARLQAKAEHNLAVLDHLAGDLPTALARFREVAEAYAVEAPGMLPVLALDRSRALLSAGLVTEADRSLADAVRRLGGQRVGQDLAEAQLERAAAALLAGRPGVAREQARRAARVLARRDNPRWAARARLVALRADLARLGGVPGAGSERRGGAARATGTASDVATRALVLRDELAGLGLGEPARVAGVVGARAMLRTMRGADETDEPVSESEARMLLSQSRPRAADRLDTRLGWRLARAEVAASEGDTASARREAARGLADLHEARVRLGAVDLRGGSSVHGRELARLGLGLAVRDGRAAEVLAWSERARAQALLLPPVLPPDDPRAASWLAELRGVDATMSARRDEGQPVGDLRARQDQLRRRLREQSWTVSGTPAAQERVGLGRLREELGRDAALVAWLPVGRRLSALVVSGGSAVVLDGGPSTAVVAALRRLIADLDAAVGRSLPDRLAAAVAASTSKDAAALDDLLLGPLRHDLGDRSLVVVPTGMLLAVPWAVLPSTRQRPVSVAPSATGWVRARKGMLRGTGAGTSALLVAGPGLAHSTAEATSLAARFDAPTVLTGADAAVTPVLAQLPAVDLAHLATHGHHVADNALFSGLELADGRLMGYDVQSLSRVPRLVVLSACDVGLHDVRPGDESLGVATAFLGSGASTVVASVTRVSDAGAPAVMAAFHAALGGGATPAQALAGAADGTGFVCFGAG